MSAADLLSNIKDCCSKTPDFITGDLPVLESVFRLFLANGNQPLGLEELQKQLGERRGGDIYRTPVEILPRQRPVLWAKAVQRSRRLELLINPD
jgi:hypothetical protein